jgi:beta-glucosidase
VAYTTAAEAIVLLKNDSSVLPLDLNVIKSIAVIGDNAKRKHSSGGQSSEIKALYEVTPFEALQKKFGSTVALSYAQGYEKQSKSSHEVAKGAVSYNKVDTALLDEAVAQAKRADVAIVFCGLNHDFDTESSDKPDMKLPYGQVKLIQEVAKANPKTVVVLVAGSPVELAGIDNRVPSILWGWYNGMEGGNAIVDVLSGKVNPSGKMPFTLPVSLEQSPAHALGNFPGRDLKVNYEEDILVGYRWFDTKNITPEYPFGYGLSYTQFKYDNLALNQPAFSKDDVVKVSFTLTNTGKVVGAEVAQLYMSQPKASVLRPVKELKGFKKVWLQPGEAKRVELEVKVADLAYYNEQSKSWIVESGSFEFLLGASSRDIRQQISFNVR